MFCYKLNDFSHLLSIVSNCFFSTNIKVLKMKAIILFAISSGLLFSITNAATPTVTFTANPNSVTVDTPFNVKCHVENVDLKKVTSMTVFYWFNVKDPTNSNIVAPVPLGGWNYLNLTGKLHKKLNTLTFV